jgi:hypothetical protein
MSKKSKLYDLPTEDYILGTEPESSFIDELRQRFAFLEDISLEDLYFNEFCVREDFDYAEFILTKRLKAILREMTIRLYNNICTVRSHAYDLFSYISLLFGLCSSQSSFIFRAFFGASLSRIPSM